MPTSIALSQANLTDLFSFYTMVHKSIDQFRNTRTVSKIYGRHKLSQHTHSMAQETPKYLTTSPNTWIVAGWIDAMMLNNLIESVSTRGRSCYDGGPLNGGPFLCVLIIPSPPPPAARGSKRELPEYPQSPDQCRLSRERKSSPKTIDM